VTKDHDASEFEAIDLLTTVYLGVYILFRGFTLSKLGRLMFIMTIRARPGSIVCSSVYMHYTLYILAWCVVV
jgi:hypothetical protein